MKGIGLFLILTLMVIGVSSKMPNEIKKFYALEGFKSGQIRWSGYLACIKTDQKLHRCSEWPKYRCSGESVGSKDLPPTKEENYNATTTDLPPPIEENYNDTTMDLPPAPPIEENYNATTTDLPPPIEENYNATTTDLPPPIEENYNDTTMDLPPPIEENYNVLNGTNMEPANETSCQPCTPNPPSLVKLVFVILGLVLGFLCETIIWVTVNYLKKRKKSKKEKMAKIDSRIIIPPSSEPRILLPGTAYQPPIENGNQRIPAGPQGPIQKIPESGNQPEEFISIPHSLASSLSNYLNKIQ